MRNLLQFFFRFGGFFLFFFLELFCLFLILQYNHKQKAVWDSSMSAFSGFLNELADDVQTHLTYAEIVDSLSRQNAIYQEIIFNAKLNEITRWDSLENGRQKYQTIAAKVISYSTNKKHNHLTLNKGWADGVQQHSAVIDGTGIVGIVKNASKYYSTVLPLLHRQSSVAANIRRNNYGGSLIWKGEDTQTMNLNYVPKHIQVVEGDTIQTSGASAMFPSEIMIGTVQKVDQPPGSNFYDIQVKLVNDFHNLNFVYIVVNLERTQQKNLEKEVANE